MRLILNKSTKYHPSRDTVKEFEKIIISDPQIQTAIPANEMVSRLAYSQWRLLNKLGIVYNPLSSLYKFESKSNITKLFNYFVLIMGCEFYKCLPYFQRPGSKSIYMFDAWEEDHEMISQFVKHFKVEYLFLSSSQAVENLKYQVGQTKVYWIPEGISPDEYEYYPNESKDIDVLSFGRKYDRYHEKIKEDLKEQQVKYVFAESPGKVIFPSRESFIDGLARSKISICFPSNITHPERAGNIETMTIRYLQSMVSKNLIVGKAPVEMITLFGYNPVIEADMQDPAGQLKDIINNYADYTSLVERNYAQVLKDHSWQNRWQSIREIFAKKS
jgi:glycosyltransferase involved in cell wall biosynthesis